MLEENRIMQRSAMTYRVVNSRRESVRLVERVITTGNVHGQYLGATRDGIRHAWLSVHVDCWTT